MWYQHSGFNWRMITMAVSIAFNAVYIKICLYTQMQMVIIAIIRSLLRMCDTKSVDTEFRSYLAFYYYCFYGCIYRVFTLSCVLVSFLFCEYSRIYYRENIVLTNECSCTQPQLKISSKKNTRITASFIKTNVERESRQEIFKKAIECVRNGSFAHSRKRKR